MTDLDTVAACEERLVNVWPALQTLMMGPWVLRFARGYSGRANAASAIRAGADLDTDDLDHIATLYRQAGLAPAIRVSPLCVDALAPRLVAAGWRKVVTSIGMVADATKWPDHGSVALAAAPSPAWIEGVCAWQDGRKRNGADFAAILNQLRLPATFAAVAVAGAPVGYGMAVCDRGMAEIGSIMIGPDHRGRGLGRAVVETLLAWTVRTGAGRVFLQVEATNAPAIALYRDLGFAEVYRYSEYRL